MLSRLLPWLVVCLLLQTGPPPAISPKVAAEPSAAILETLARNQYDLSSTGQYFLLHEAQQNHFFMLGELHGENEIPSLLHALWPMMWKAGYRHIAAEISPWEAHQLEFGPRESNPSYPGLWTRSQANDAHALATTGATVLWGCDMEEIHPEGLIRELAAANPRSPQIQQMNQMTGAGYSRKIAPDLLRLLDQASDAADKEVNGISLRQNLAETLEIDQLRSRPDLKLAASNKREVVMKRQFLAHLQQDSVPGQKVLLRFGRNHLHRGYDARGVSTLGNFVAEFAIAHGWRTFNVGAFAAGGRATLMGETWEADERQDEPAFAVLADKARSAATIFDLRPLRPLLHAIAMEKRTTLETNLAYWADSYDALICYRSVTPQSDQ